jgi:hypothetical protein
MVFDFLILTNPAIGNRAVGSSNLIFSDKA